MDHLKTAYTLGARLARTEFAKQAEPALGDPAYWQGGEQAQQEQQQAPATAEDAAMSLPTGTFQGLTTRLSPEGERSTSVKVTPDALGNPDILGGIFQAEPTAKVEVAQPQAKADGAAAAQQDLGIPNNLPGSPPPDPLTGEGASKMGGLRRLQRIIKGVTKGVHNTPELRHAGARAEHKLFRRASKFPSGPDGYLRHLGLDPASANPTDLLRAQPSRLKGNLPHDSAWREILDY
jgi:hypothetical protein